MSGGVDSTVSAHFLKKKGFEVIGVFMKNWDTVDETGICRADKEAEDAEYACKQIGIPFQTVDFVKEYWNEVFEKLVEEECSLEPFSQHVQKDADFRPFLDMFKKCSRFKFCYLTTKHLRDNEYKKLENIFLKSEKIKYLIHSDYSRNKFTLVGIFDH